MKTRPFDVLTFGSITFDVFITPSFSEVGLVHVGNDDNFCFKVGDKIKVDDVFRSPGGGSANVSIALSKLGLRCAAFGVVGDDQEAYFVIEKFRNYNISTDYLIQERKSLSSFSIILMAPDGRRTVFHDRNTNKRFCAKMLQKAPEAKAIYIGHLYDESKSILSEIENWKERSGGIVAWNPGKTQFNSGFESFEKVFPHVDLLLLNLEEAEQFTEEKGKKICQKDATAKQIGKKIHMKQEDKDTCVCYVRDIAQRFLDVGVKTVVITDNKRGSQLFEEDQHFFCPAPKVAIKSTLGAGDSFAAAVLAAKLRGESVENQLLWGSLNGGSVVQEFGAQEGQLTNAEIQKQIRKS